MSKNTTKGIKAIEGIKSVLANSYILYLKTQNYHWNVTGPNFKSLHELFGNQYEELAGAIDELAERIRALGDYAPGSFKVFSTLSDISEETGKALSASSMLKQLVKDTDIILSVIRGALEAAQQANDDATADMLIGRIEMHDKNKWMLSSSI